MPHIPNSLPILLRFPVREWWVSAQGGEGWWVACALWWAALLVLMRGAGFRFGGPFPPAKMVADPLEVWKKSSQKKMKGGHPV